MGPKKLNWKQETKNEITLLSLDLFLRGLKRSYLRKMGLNYKHYKKVRDEGYIVVESHKEFQDKLRKKARKDPKYMKNIFDMQYEDCKKLVDVCKKFWKKDFSNSCHSELKKNFLEVVQVHFNSSYALFNPIPFGNLFEDVIGKQLRKKTSDRKKIEEYLRILTTPSKETTTGKTEKILLRIAQNPSDDKIRDYIGKYGWLNAKFGYGRPFSFDEIKSRIINLRQSNSKKRLSEIRKRLSLNKKRTTEILEELNLGGGFEEIVELGKENVFFRTYRLEIFSLAGYYATGLYNEIAKRLGVSYDELFFLTIKEICRYLDKRQEIDKRREGLGALYDDGKITFYIGDEIKQIEEVKKEEPNKSIFKGITACKGTARGKAKIVKAKKDLAKIEKGDILLAEFTTPDFVPAMEKAAAIVADLGGLTSHTAIIGRELGKPCVVGVKNASRIIKDNDDVFVDADNGIVRKTLGLKKFSTGDYKVALIMILFFEGFDKEQEKLIGFGHKNAVIVFNNLRTKAFMDPKEMEEVGKLVIKKLDQDPLFGEKIISMHLKSGKYLLKLCKKINRANLGRKTNKQLYKILRKYFKVFKNFAGFHIMPVSLEKEMAKKVTEYLKPLVKDVNDTILALTTPSDETNLTREKNSLLRIAIVAKSRDVSKMIDEHTKKYGWMGVNHKFTPYTRDYFAKRVKGIKDPEKGLEESLANPGKVEAKREKVLEGLDIPNDIKLLIDMLRKFTFMRDFKRDTGYKSHYYMEKLWEEIAKRANLRAEHVKNCTPKEVENFLLGKIQPDRKILDERLKYQVLALFNGKSYLLIGDEARKIEESEAKEEEIQETTSFKGMPACKGTAQGTVKIVLKPSEISKVKEGDILVAVNTEPAMVPAMEKAAAFITDEGGITCHAAIVSREMNKPCIIGTKIATRMLKDGDKVKVDANKGIVRKIM